MSEEDMVQVFISKQENQSYDWKLSTNELHREEIKEAAEEMGFSSMSEAIRTWIQIGRRAVVDTDPRSTTSDSDDGATTIRDLVPEGKENAVDMRDELIEIIDGQLLEIVSDDPKIKKDGWEVYVENEG